MKRCTTVQNVLEERMMTSCLSTLLDEAIDRSRTQHAGVQPSSYTPIGRRVFRSSGILGLQSAIKKKRMNKNVGHLSHSFLHKTTEFSTSYKNFKGDQKPTVPDFRLLGP